MIPLALSCPPPGVRAREPEPVPVAGPASLGVVVGREGSGGVGPDDGLLVGPACASFGVLAGWADAWTARKGREASASKASDLRM